MTEADHDTAASPDASTPSVNSAALPASLSVEELALLDELIEQHREALLCLADR